MIFKTNLYSHAVNQAIIQMSTRYTKSKRGKPSRLVKSLSVSGELLASGVSAITTAIDALEDGYDGTITFAGLFDDDGTTQTSHYIEDDRDCFGGIQVLSINYPKGDATEYVNGRMFEIQLEAQYISRDGGELQEFEETLRYRGTGGPRRVNLLTLNGPPVRQITNKRTLQQISQSGRAVGLTAYPVGFMSRPVRPGDELEDQREITYGQPEWELEKRINWPLSWSYIMEF